MADERRLEEVNFRCLDYYGIIHSKLKLHS